MTRATPFVLDGDEPPILLGSNKGPNAVELLLQALGFCYAVGLVANAAARGIEISRMDYEIEGDIDVHQFLGLDGPRAGFIEISAKGHGVEPERGQGTAGRALPVRAGHVSGTRQSRSRYSDKDHVGGG